MTPSLRPCGAGANDAPSALVQVDLYLTDRLALRLAALLCRAEGMTRSSVRLVSIWNFTLLAKEKIYISRFIQTFTSLIQTFAIRVLSAISAVDTLPWVSWEMSSGN